MVVQSPPVDKYGRPDAIKCTNGISCNRWGNTVIPYTPEPVVSLKEYNLTIPFNTLSSTVITQAYDDLIHKYLPKPKEQDMCNSVKRWGVTIEPSNKNSDGSDTYYVRFQHKDKSTTDELTRNFDTFELALDFANKKYKELK